MIYNPILLGIFSTILVIIYSYYRQWNANKELSINEKKPYTFDYLVPGIVGLIVWFFVAAYNDITDIKNVELSEQITTNSISSQSGGKSASYHLIGKNTIRLPATDVFIDIAKF